MNFQASKLIGLTIWTVILSALYSWFLTFPVIGLTLLFGMLGMIIVTVNKGPMV